MLTPSIVDLLFKLVSFWKIIIRQYMLGFPYQCICQELLVLPPTAALRDGHYHHAGRSLNMDASRLPGQFIRIMRLEGTGKSMCPYSRPDKITNSWQPLKCPTPAASHSCNLIVCSREQLRARQHPNNPVGNVAHAEPVLPASVGQGLGTTSRGVQGKRLVNYIVPRVNPSH